MLRLITALAKSSQLRFVSPLEKLFLTIIPIIILSFTKDIYVIVFNIVFFIILHIAYKNNLKIVFEFTSEIAGFVAFSSLTFVFTYGLPYVGVIILKSISAGLCLSFLSLTTPMDDIFYVLSKINFLKDFCDIGKSMFRFIMLLQDEYHLLYISVKSRNGFDTFKLKVVNTGKIAALLFVNTMRRWKDIKDGINSRCYTGSISYISKEFSFSIKRFLFICLYVGLLLALIIEG